MELVGLNDGLCDAIAALSNELSPTFQSDLMSRTLLRRKARCPSYEHARINCKSMTGAFLAVHRPGRILVGSLNAADIRIDSVEEFQEPRLTIRACSLRCTRLSTKQRSRH